MLDVVEGHRPTTNLAEVLAVDTRLLFERVFPSIAVGDAERAVLALPSITARMTNAGAILHRSFGLSCLTTLRAHPADTVRGWAPYVVGRDATLSLTERLDLVRPSADDGHFGVREWAWLGIRAHIAANVCGGHRRADDLDAIDLAAGAQVRHRGHASARRVGDADRAAA
jgi:hypothetical protein